jgi:hypothetical protein
MSGLRVEGERTDMDPHASPQSVRRFMAFAL